MTTKVSNAEKEIKAMTTTTNDLSYEPTTEDITAYNEDQAKRDAEIEIERAEVAKAKANGTWGIFHCPDGTLHYWVELSQNEQMGAYELASELEIARARKCLKCGAWK